MFLEGIQDVLQRIAESEAVRAEFWQVYHMHMGNHVQFMEEVVETGHYRRPHATTFAKDCPRQAAFDALGYTRDHLLDGYVTSKFITGYCIEAKILALLEMSGVRFVSMAFNVPRWWWADEPIVVHPDGMTADACIEIKSITQAGYDAWVEKGVRRAEPRYYDQAHIEMAGANRTQTVFLVEDKNKNRIYEEVVEWDQREWDRIDWMFYDIEKHRDPFYVARPENIYLSPITTFHKGKSVPEGVPARMLTKATNSKGWHIGWYEDTGVQKLSYPCSYCGWRATCWARDGYELEEELDDRGYPVIRATKKELVF